MQSSFPAAGALSSGRYKRPRQAEDAAGRSAKMIRGARGAPEFRESTPPEEATSDDDGADDDDAASHVREKKQRRNKHVPAEMSSKRPVSRFRQVVEVPKLDRRDPRFEDISGTYNHDIFRKSYSFLDGYRDTEIDALKAEVAKQQDAQLRADSLALLRQMQQSRAETQRSDSVRAVLSAAKHEEAGKVAAGKKPFFLKKRQLKEIVAVERFKELEGRGDAAVAKAMRKKSKKRLEKHHKKELIAPRRNVPEQAAGAWPEAKR